MDHQDKSHVQIVIERGLNDYLQFFKSFSSETVAKLDAVAIDQVYFSDPFNSVTGRTRLKEVWGRFFDVANDVRITVNASALNGDRAFVSWDMTYKAVSGKKNKENYSRVTISGVSELRFDPAGRLLSREDYWDAAQNFYEKLPIAGQVIRYFKGRMKP